MRTERVEITIDKVGGVKMKVSGVPGMDCLRVTAAVEDALGGELLSRDMTEEAYATQEEQSNVQESGW